MNSFYWHEYVRFIAKNCAVNIFHNLSGLPQYNISWKMSQTLTAIYDKNAFFMFNVIIQSIVDFEKSIFTQSDTLIQNIYHFSPL